MLFEVIENQQLHLSGIPFPTNGGFEQFELIKKQSIIRRTVSLRSGEERVSDIFLPSGLVVSENLADSYDLAWLQSKSKPVAINSSNNKTIRAADLFCGCGGLSVGLREAARALETEVEFVFASDINEAALSVYQQNISPSFSSSLPIESYVDGDLGAKVTSAEKALIDKIGRIDFVFAGPPCQGHSDLNNHTRRDDPKNQLVLRVARFAELFRPKFLVIENVPGIKHDRLGSLLDAKKALSALGYSLDETLMRAEKFGVPQARKRFFLVAVLDGESDLSSLDMSHESQSRDVAWAITDLLGTSATDIFDTSAVHSQENKRRIKFLFEHGLYDLPNSERPSCHRDKKHSYTSVYGRMHWNKPSQTITTGFGSVGQGRFVHPLKERTLTPHEAARIQFFPDFFEFGNFGRRQLQLLIGNAVPSKLAYVLALHQLR
ncbi:DNA cytosine methyltransferase [Pseudomonas sp. RA_105y_Pfl2_P56]|uniref:DNA cytosine methyltransferase n=1 Tax=Pseudomonas sp. RA_105y_Pfl2_P56 TaxID=3088701 RepID=UPI0030D6D332